MSPRIYYNPDLKERASFLRNNSTISEILLWKAIKTKINGYRFVRQKPLLNYIADFYCQKLSLAIEIDGNSHDLKGNKDYLRQHDLEEIGIKFLRFTDMEVKTNLNGVVQAITNYIEENTPEITLSPS